VVKCKLLIWSCIKWEPIFALIFKIVLGHIYFHMCGELFFHYNFVKCVLYSICGLYKFMFFIKCYKNECNNFICDIFNVNFYNPSNDVCMK
jgi:hypothetical protein